MSQERFIRWNVSASGPHPNPHGSFRHSLIKVTEVYVLKNKAPLTIDGKKRTTLSAISFVNPSSPIRLHFSTKPLMGPPKMKTPVVNGTYRGFMEVILQNNDTKMQIYHEWICSFFCCWRCPGWHR